MWAAATQAASPDVDSSVFIWGSIITLMGVCVTAVFSYLSHREAKMANSAVNHKKPGQDRLFDMVADTRDKVAELDQWRGERLTVDAALADKLVHQFQLIDDRIVHTSDLLSRRVTRLDLDNAVAHADFANRLHDVESKIDTRLPYPIINPSGEVPVVAVDITPKETP